MHRPFLGVIVLAAAVLNGCASVTCAPITIVVASKDERPQLRSEPRTLRTDELGRLKEERRDGIVSEYWIADREGHWYRVPEAQWRSVEPGQSVQVCR